MKESISCYIIYKVIPFYSVIFYTNLPAQREKLGNCFNPSFLTINNTRSVLQRCRSCIVHNGGHIQASPLHKIIFITDFKINSDKQLLQASSPEMNKVTSFSTVCLQPTTCNTSDQQWIGSNCKCCVSYIWKEDFHYISGYNQTLIYFFWL